MSLHRHRLDDDRLVGLAAAGAGVHRAVVPGRRDLVEDLQPGLVHGADDGVVGGELGVGEHQLVVVLKGHKTFVAMPGGKKYFNTTGNPGMATGGMGDILTGVCAGLAGQGLSLYDAARFGAWLCGRAAEIAIFNGSQSEQSVLPRDILDHLGQAFNELKG